MFAMQMRTFAVLLISVLAPIGLARADCSADVMALRQILAFEPAALAKLNARNGDLRFFELHGLFSAVPGVQDQECARTSKQTVLLQGSANAACSREHEALRARSYQFAELYNQAMVRLRSEKGLPTCERR